MHTTFEENVGDMLFSNCLPLRMWAILVHYVWISKSLSKNDDMLFSLLEYPCWESMELWNLPCAQLWSSRLGERWRGRYDNDSRQLRRSWNDTIIFQEGIIFILAGQGWWSSRICAKNFLGTSNFSAGCWCLWACTGSSSVLLIQAMALE